MFNANVNNISAIS